MKSFRDVTLTLTLSFVRCCGLLSRGPVMGAALWGFRTWTPHTYRPPAMGLEPGRPVSGEEAEARRVPGPRPQRPWCAAQQRSCPHGPEAWSLNARPASEPAPRSLGLGSVACIEPGRRGVGGGGGTANDTHACAAPARRGSPPQARLPSADAPVVQTGHAFHSLVLGRVVRGNSLGQGSDTRQPGSHAGHSGEEEETGGRAVAGVD